MSNRILAELQNRGFDFTKRFTLADAHKQHFGALREKFGIKYHGIEINFFVSHCLMSGITLSIAADFISYSHPARIHFDYNDEYRVEFDPSTIRVFSETDRQHMKNWQAVNLAVAELCEALLMIDDIEGIKEAIKANQSVAAEYYQSKK